MDWLAGYHHALGVAERAERDRLIRESKWPADRLRGFVVGSAEADRAELCAKLRVTARDTIAKLREIDPLHPMLAEMERDLALVDQLEREPLALTWLAARADAN